MQTFVPWITHRNGIGSLKIYTRKASNTCFFKK